MAMTQTPDRPATDAELQELIKEADIGGREPAGAVGR